MLLYVTLQWYHELVFCFSFYLVATIHKFTTLSVVGFCANSILEPFLPPTRKPISYHHYLRVSPSTYLPTLQYCHFPSPYHDKFGSLAPLLDSIVFGHYYGFYTPQMRAHSVSVPLLTQSLSMRFSRSIQIEVNCIILCCCCFFFF